MIVCTIIAAIFWGMLVIIIWQHILLKEKPQRMIIKVSKIVMPNPTNIDDFISDVAGWSDKYQAQIKGDTTVACGRNSYEAVGDLIYRKRDKFVIEYLGVQEIQ